MIYQGIAVLLHILFRHHGKVHAMKTTPFTVKKQTTEHLYQLTDCPYPAAKRTANKTSKRSNRTYREQQAAARRLIEGVK